MSLLSYIKKYGNYTFSEKAFNEVDNVIFSCLSYVNLEEIVSSNRFYKKRLEDVATLYFSSNSKKDNRNNVSEVRNGIKLLYEVWHTKRFRDVLLFHYLYIGNSESQFSAISFEYLKGYVYVAFEGTDEMLSGWEEDFKIAYTFPVAAQGYAINYLKKNFLLSLDHLILGGHSKGGHLAIIALMNAPGFLFSRISTVYSNDGLGLRKEEFYSKKYEKIRSKVIQIVPDYSTIGLLLYHDSHFLVVKSKSKGFFAHNPKNWIVDDDHFQQSKLSRFSSVFDQGMSQWLESYTIEEKETFARSVFDLARAHNFTSLLDFKKNKLAFFRMIVASKKIDSKTKEMTQELISILIKCNREYKVF